MVMRRPTAAAMVLAAMLAAGTSWAQEGSRGISAVHTATVQLYKSIEFHSDLGPASVQALERWHRTWKATKRRLGWSDDFPPEPAGIYFLNEDNFRLVRWGCGERCPNEGLPISGNAMALYYTDWGFPAGQTYETTMGISGSVGHEFLHIMLEWVYQQNRRFSDDPFWRSPQLIQLVQSAMAGLEKEAGRNANPGVLDPVRYDKLIAVVKRTLGWESYIDAAARAPDVDGARTLWFNWAQQNRGLGEEGVATGLTRLFLGALDQHGLPGLFVNLFYLAVWSIIAEVDRECAADGACPNYDTARAYGLQW